MPDQGKANQYIGGESDDHGQLLAKIQEELDHKEKFIKKKYILPPTTAKKFTIFTNIIQHLRQRAIN